MKEQKYLIAIALAEQNNKRLMPIGGKTFEGVNNSSQIPQKEAEKIILDLLLRLFKRTNEGDLKISNTENGILLAEINLLNMQNNIPIIKSDWINTGDTINLIDKLLLSCSNLWSVDYKKHEGILFNELKNK